MGVINKTSTRRPKILFTANDIQSSSDVFNETLDASTVGGDPTVSTIDYNNTEIPIPEPFRKLYGVTQLIKITVASSSTSTPREAGFDFTGFSIEMPNELIDQFGFVVYSPQQQGENGSGSHLRYGIRAFFGQNTTLTAPFRGFQAARNDFDEDDGIGTCGWQVISFHESQSNFDSGVIDWADPFQMCRIRCEGLDTRDGYVPEVGETVEFYIGMFFMNQRQEAGFLVSADDNDIEQMHGGYLGLKNITSVTQGATTTINFPDHPWSNGDKLNFRIAGGGMTELDGIGPLTISGVTATSFDIAIDSTLFTAFTTAVNNYAYTDQTNGTFFGPHAVHNIPLQLYVNPATLDGQDENKMTWDDLRFLEADAGWRIYSHFGYSRTTGRLPFAGHPDLTLLNPVDLQDEIDGTKAAFQAEGFNNAFQFSSYPEGAHNVDVMEALRANGYVTGWTVTGSGNWLKNYRLFHSMMYGVQDLNGSRVNIQDDSSGSGITEALILAQIDRAKDFGAVVHLYYHVPVDLTQETTGARQISLTQLDNVLSALRTELDANLMTNYSDQELFAAMSQTTVIIGSNFDGGTSRTLVADSARSHAKSLAYTASSGDKITDLFCHVRNNSSSVDANATLSLYKLESGDITDRLVMSNFVIPDTTAEPDFQFYTESIDCNLETGVQYIVVLESDGTLLISDDLVSGEDLQINSGASWPLNSDDPFTGTNSTNVNYSIGGTVLRGAGGIMRPIMSSITC